MNDRVVIDTPKLHIDFVPTKWHMVDGIRVIEEVDVREAYLTVEKPKKIVSSERVTGCCPWC